MQWREMALKDKVKDEAPPKDVYVSNALYTKLCGHPSECMVIPEGALVMAGMSLSWHDIKLYPSFRRDDEGEWSLFDFVDPPRHAALKATNRILGEQEPDVLKIHLEQFLLPTVPADPTAYVTIPPPSGGRNVVAIEKKPIKVKITGRKYMVVGTGASSASVTTSTGSVAEQTSPTHVSKKRKVVTLLLLSRQFKPLMSYLLVKCIICPISVYGNHPVCCWQTQPLQSYITCKSYPAVSCPMPPPMPTAVVAVTTSLVSTPLPSSVIPSTLFYSPLSVFSTSEKETPTVFAAHEATNTQDATLSDVGGSSSGIADDGARLGDDLYLPTINWDPTMQDKWYQPKWKTAESSRLIFPPVIQHWVERAYPPAESAYVEGLNNENLMNSTIVNSVSHPRRLA
ncbi:hypothetical protein Hanom_Chr02g00138701 [Helianthus anomalus]